MTLRSGRIRGKLVDGVNTFLGVPYGAPTGGGRRFLAPQREAPWTGVRDAFEWGPIAPQSGRPRGARQLEFWSTLRPASTQGESEDCLYLNVWTRGLADRGKRPVMVWLHGGGYDQGSGGSTGYSGEDLARDHDVVAVSINHRLHVGSAPLPGRDPRRRVRGIGQSRTAGHRRGPRLGARPRRGVRRRSGARDDLWTVGRRRQGDVPAGHAVGQGKFHAAAVQSGGARGGEKDLATQSAERLLAAFGLTRANARDLQKVPLLDQLMKVAAGARNDRGAAGLGGRGDRDRVRWGPVLDGEVIPEDPNASPLSKNVPVIVGATRTEQLPYTGGRREIGKDHRAGAAGERHAAGRRSTPPRIAATGGEARRESAYDVDATSGHNVRAPARWRPARPARPGTDLGQRCDGRRR